MNIHKQHVKREGIFESTNLQVEVNCLADVVDAASRNEKLKSQNQLNSLVYISISYKIICKVQRACLAYRDGVNTFPNVERLEWLVEQE